MAEYVPYLGWIRPSRTREGRQGVCRPRVARSGDGRDTPPDMGIEHEVSPDRVADLEASSRGEVLEMDMEQQELSRRRHVFVLTGGRNTGAGVDQLS